MCCPNWEYLVNNPEFFNVLDYVWLIILFASLFIGFIKGFIKDFFGTCSWVASAFLSSLFSPYFLPTIGKHIPNLLVAKCVALVITFSVLLMAFKIVINILSESVRGTCLSGLDRLFGACFGLARGVSILITFALLSLFFGVQQNRFEILRESKISTLLYRIANMLMPSVENIIGIKFPKYKPIKLETRNPVKNLSEVPIAKEKSSRRKQQEDSEETLPPSAVEKLKDYMAEVFATKQMKKERIEEEEALIRRRYPIKEKSKEEEPKGLKVIWHLNKKPEVDKYKKVRPEYGFMRLLDAKKKRLEKLRKRRLKRQFRQQLEKIKNVEKIRQAK